MSATRIGFVLFPRMTQPDLTGPYEMLARVPGVEVLLLARDGQPVETELGLRILPTVSLDDAPPFDLLCVPGGPGVNALLEDDAVLDFLAARGARARWVTSVCTGALALGAAVLTEYDPAPPFPGSPRTAAPEVVESVRSAREGLQSARRRLCEAAVARRAPRA
jgi:putative intracellular protease/amidase